MDLKAQNISKRFYRKAGESNYFYAVHETDLELPSGALSVLMGRSGSGKTTLLSLLSGLLSPDTGTVTADGRDLYSMGDRKLYAFRAARISVMPQGRAVLDTLSAWENVFLNARIAGIRDESLVPRALELMERFGIPDLKEALPKELSGGELRRVMLCRSLLLSPDVLMCDEPTGDLDDQNTALVLDSLRDYAHQGHTVLLVTHEADAVSYADRLLQMDAGRISTPDPA